MINKDTSYVYFDRKDIANGVYKRKNFFFQISPFTMERINSLPPDDLKFDGKLVSGGIFPDLNQVIKVQKDYSLGFQSAIPEPGFAVYGGKGTYSDTLKLNNSGLQGSGRLVYLSSVTESNKFLFTPDSTIAVAKNFQLASDRAQYEFPDVQAKNAAVK